MRDVVSQRLPAEEKRVASSRASSRLSRAACHAGRAGVLAALAYLCVIAASGVRTLINPSAANRMQSVAAKSQQSDISMAALEAVAHAPDDGRWTFAGWN